MNIAKTFIETVSKNKEMINENFKHFTVGKTYNGTKVTCDPVTGAHHEDAE